MNDLPKSLASKIRLFADDEIASKERNSADDCQILQNDQAELTSWEDLLLINFVPSKCKVLPVTPKDYHLYAIIPCMTEH